METSGGFTRYLRGRQFFCGDQMDMGTRDRRAEREPNGFDLHRAACMAFACIVNKYFFFFLGPIAPQFFPAQVSAAKTTSFKGINQPLVTWKMLTLNNLLSPLSISLPFFLFSHFPSLSSSTSLSLP